MLKDFTNELARIDVIMGMPTEIDVLENEKPFKEKMR
jgi:hypothetical protein